MGRLIGLDLSVQEEVTNEEAVNDKPSDKANSSKGKKKEADKSDK